MFNTALAVVLCSLCVLTAAHPTVYNTNPDCYHPFAPFYSYHIHVLFISNDNASTSFALDLRKQFEQTFKPGAPCDGLFHQDRLCMFDTEMDPNGPFLTAQWAAFIPLEYYANTTNWIMQHRGPLDFVVHPNSGCSLADHTDWAYWGGYRWKLDTSVFRPDEPWG